MISIGRNLGQERFRRLVTFLAVGCTSASVYAGLCSVLLQRYIGCDSLISISVYVGLVPPGFLAQRYFTFRSSGSVLREFFAYASLQVLSIFLSTALLVSLLTGDAVINLVIFLIIAGLAAIINFLACNAFVFRGLTGRSREHDGSKTRFGIPLPVTKRVFLGETTGPENADTNHKRG